MSARAVWAALVLVCAAGCEWDFERMIDQPHLRAYEYTPYFDDGTTMQIPPEGTVPFLSGTDAALTRSTAPGGGFTEVIPIPLDPDVVEYGHDRFLRFCAPCHGRQADGSSPVARSMSLRKPPSLFEARIAAAAPGRLYAVISDGFGLMPGYAHALESEERWAVVAFVQALQLSRAVRLDQLSPRQRAEAERRLP